MGGCKNLNDKGFNAFQETINNLTNMEDFPLGGRGGKKEQKTKENQEEAITRLQASGLSESV